jgi:sarcosine oxidase delta subunit
MSNVVAEDRELIECPDCGSDLRSERPQGHGNGIITRHIWCPDCDFDATEEFEITGTYRRDKVE